MIRLEKNAQYSVIAIFKTILKINSIFFFHYRYTEHLNIRIDYNPCQGDITWYIIPIFKQEREFYLIIIYNRLLTLQCYWCMNEYVIY